MPTAERDVGMKMLDMKNLKRIMILIFTVLAVLIFVRALCIDGISEKIYMEDATKFNNGWLLVSPTSESGENAVSNENAGDDGSMARVVFPPTVVEAKAYEPVTLVNTVPILRYGTGTLMFASTQQTVVVEIDGHVIYTYGSFDDERFIETVPSVWNFVPIPADAVGKELSVTLTSAYDNFAGEITTFYLGPLQQCKGQIVRTSILNLFLSLMILVIGIVVLVMYFIIRHGNEKYEGLLHWGCFTLLIGIWALCECMLDQFVTTNPYFEWSLKLLALFSVPIPLMLHARTRALDTKNRVVIDYLLLTCIFASIVCFALQMAGIVDLLQSLFIAHIQIAVTGITFIITMMRILKTPEGNLAWIRIVGLVLLITCFAVECFFFYTKNYWAISNNFRIMIIIVTLIWGIETMIDVWERAKRTSAAEQEIVSQQVNRMISQIHPHFIYNTLSAIRTLIMRDPEVASDIVYKFSKYLRTNIDSMTNGAPVPFHKELEHIRTYLEIEQVRFGDRLAVEMNIEEDSFLVPPLSIQPLVENAVKHGICKKTEGGTLKMHTYSTKSEYIVEICDDGIGFDMNEGTLAGEAMRTSAGLKNVRLRLEVMTDAKLVIKSELGEGTTTIVSIPKEAIERMQKNEDNSGRR